MLNPGDYSCYETQPVRELRLQLTGNADADLPDYICDSLYNPSKSISTLPMSRDEILRTVEAEFHLNEKQSNAFNIIANHYIARYIDNKSEEKPMRLLLTGSGGTGKTHIVKAIQAVMGHYGCSHKL